jgi:hypothetical protein
VNGNIETDSIVELIESHRDGAATFPAGWQFAARAQPYAGDVLVKCPATGYRGTVPVEKLELVAAPPAPKKRKTLKQLVKSGAVMRGSTLEAGHGRR